MADLSHSRLDSGRTPADDESCVNPFWGGITSRLIAACWVALIVGGFGVIILHNARLSGQAVPLARAEGVVFQWLDDRPYQVVLALQPRCPCSQATVTELAKVAGDFRQQVGFVVLVAAPLDAGDDFIATSLVQRARDELRAHIVTDIDSRIAAQLAMHVSGSIVLIDSAGQVRFYGGVTWSRGNEGPSLGLSAVRRIVSGGSATATSAPVFGCDLASPRETGLSSHEAGG